MATSLPTVERPVGTEAIAAAMRAAADRADVVVVQGAGTKPWGHALDRPVGTVVELRAHDRVLEHEPGDLVVRVETGCRLAALQAALAAHAQRLAIDEVVPGSTVGGVLATGLAGPLRHRFGTPRDLILGATVVLADGTVAASGSKVVKNVAGYDLARLHVGAYGTLGVIAEATLRVHPVPPAAAFVVTALEGGSALSAALAAVADSQDDPAAVEIDRPEQGAPVALAVLLEGTAAGVEARAARLTAVLPRSRVAADPPLWWGRLPGPTLAKVSVPAGAVGRVVSDLPDDVRGSAGVGALYVGWSPHRSADVAAELESVRGIAAAAEGSAVLLRSPVPLDVDVDVWGPVAGLEIMRRIKDVLDPDHRLAPGRFVGGI